MSPGECSAPGSPAVLWGRWQIRGEGRSAPNARELRKLCQAVAEKNVLCRWLLVTDRLGTVLSCFTCRGAGGFWLFWALCGQFRLLFSVGLGSAVCGVRPRGVLRLCAVPGSGMFIGMSSTVRGSPLLLRGRCWATPGPGWAQPALSPSIVRWLLPKLALTEQRGCSNLRLLLWAEMGIA